MRIVTLLVLSAMTLSFSAHAAMVIPVGEFRSIELNHGGHVIVRHGAVQRVSIADSDRNSISVKVEGQRLVIETRGTRPHRERRVEIEIVTPHLAEVSVSNGGTIQTVAAFPAQTSIRAAVEQGGTIDIRTIAADVVDASIDSGGGIFTTSRKTLKARVDSGGAITYWGEVQDVRKSVRHGGIVTRGKSEDAEKPLADFGLGLRPLPPLPPLPPLFDF